MVIFLSMFKKIIFNVIAEFLRWLIIWKVPLLSLNSTLKSFRKQMQISIIMTKSDKYQVKHWCV